MTLAAMRVAAALAAMAVAMPAQALTVSAGTQGFGVNRTSAGGGSAAQAMGFQQFNPALGTLSGISLGFTLGTSGLAVTAAVQDGLLATAHASAGAAMVLSVGAQALLQGGFMASATCDVFLDVPFCTETTLNLTPIGGSFEPTPTPVPSDAWAPFIGGGTVDLTAAIAALDLSSSVTTAFFGRDASAAEAFWSGQVAVTYSYSAATAEVPEPASLALLGTALGLAGLLGRRR